MKLSHAVSLTATFVAVGLSLRAAPTQAQAAPDRPNIVVIMTDDQDVDSLPVMRHLVSRPHGSWVQFTRAFTNIAICGPSRAALFTGQYGHNNHVVGNDGRPMDHTNTLPVWLDDVGYRTGLVGKYMNGVPIRGTPPPGWDFAYPAELARRDVDKYTTQAVNFINSSADGPFFLYLAYKGPHKNAKPPVRYRAASVYVPPERPNINETDMSDKPEKVRKTPKIKPKVLEGWRKERVNSQRELLGIDDGVQAVIDALEAQGVLENTLIIFTADNGFSWGSHRMTGKLCPYEECSNVPLFIRYPGLNGNRVDTHVVSNVDLASTIADYANVVPQLPQDGHSLVPLLENPQAPWEDVVLLERRGVNDFFGIRTREWKYVEYATGEKELYDLVADPYEMQSLHGRAAYSQIQATLAQRLSLMVGTYSIRGVIKDVNGVPLPGVVVTADNGQQATTGANGAYILSGLIPGTYTLTPSLPGHSFTPPTRTLTIIDRDLAEKNFTAEPVVFTISGRITFNGQPLPGVVVSTGAGLTATTDAAGTYTMTEVPRGTHTLTPILTGYLFTPPTRTVTITNSNLIDKDFTAAAVFTISGTITLDGQPLAGVTVNDGAGHTTTTDAAGVYTFAGLSPGNYTLTPILAGYVFTPPVRSVIITNQSLIDKDFTAALKTYFVSGAITLDGQPLAGVLVSDGNGHTDTTNAAGAYTVSGLLPGNHTLTPILADYVFTPPARAVTITSQDLTGRNFTAALLTYTVSGTILVDGQPLAGVLVSDGNGHTDTTDASGDYTVAGLRPGNHTLTPSKAGYTFDPATRPVTVAGGDVAGIGFAATLITYDISGTITLDGQPLPGVLVSDGQGHSDTTDANGDYTLVDLPPGTYALTPILTGYVFTPPVRTVQITNDDLIGRNFTAAPVFDISGAITLDGGQPLAGVTVSDGQGHSDTTDANGDYTLAGLPAGEYTLTPLLAGYVFTPPARTVQISDADLSGRNFTAAPIFDIAGTITVDGQPLAGVLVADDQGHSDTTDAGGAYTLSGLTPGEYTLTPALDGYTFDPTSRTVTLTDGNVSGRNFAATLITYTISGTVTRDGQPLAGVTVSDGAGHSDTTGANGDYTLAGLPPGTHTLTPTLADHVFTPPTRSVTITDQDVINQDFTAAQVFTISGTITAGGSPLAGVTVSAGAGHSATTNAAGAYTLTGLLAGNYTLTPAKAGYSFTPSSRSVTVAGESLTDQDFAAVLLTYSISGAITAGGSPLAGVIVSAGAGHTATTDASGNYALTGLLPGTYTLTPSLIGYSFTPANRSVTVNDQNVTGQNFTATLLTYSISGTILAGGQPLAGVSVSDGAGHTATTNASGGYTLTGLPVGTYTLTPAKAGYSFDPPTLSVTITNANVTGRNFTATLLTYSVSGAILVDGQPLAGVTVNDGAGHTATTNASGNYTLTGLPPGDYTLTPSRAGYSFTPPTRAVEITNANLTGQDFTATLLTYTVSGRVTLNGGGLAGVTVSDGAGHTATTDANGDYTLTGLPIGNYTLTPSLAGYSFNPPAQAVVLSNANVTGRNFTASLITYTVSGTILAGGQPLAGVSVSDGAGHSNTTNASGNYTLTGLPPGDYTLTPSLAGYTFAPDSQPVTVVASNVANVNFAATLITYSVSGQILLDGEPLPGVTVSDGAGHTDTTNGNGRYLLTGLPPGNYTLTPAKTGYSFDPVSRALNLAADTGDIDFAATLLTYTVAGTITLDGQPLPGVTVSDGAGHTDTTGANGEYTLTGLPSGSYTVTPVLSGHAFTPASRAVTVVDQNVTGQNFTASTQVYAISGTVTLNGSGLAGVTVSAGGGVYTATTNASGAYTLTDLPPGNYTVTPSKTGYTFTPGSRSVTITSANVSNRDFSASLVTYSVTGQISLDGAPLQGVVVSDGNGRTATTNASGNYTLSGLPPGNHTLTPAKAGYSFDPASLPVTIVSQNLTGQHFMAAVRTYEISGVVTTAGGQPLSGVVVADGLGGEAITDDNGFYRLVNLSPGSYTLTPALVGHSFDPASATVTVVDTDMTQDFTALGGP